VTLPTATHTERDRYETIEELNNDLSEWQAAVVRALKEGDRKVTDKLYADRLEDTARRLVKINGELHATDFAPEWIAEVRGLLLDGLQVTAAGNPLDTFDKLLINIEAIRHLLRDALDGHVEGSEDNIATIVEQLGSWLPRVSQAELAHLMNVSPRQYQRWAKMQSPPSRRAQLVARLVAILRRAWTPAGVVAWFYRPRPELGNTAPIDVLDDPGYEQELFRSVRQGRAQHGA
jgi:hypothetical protein